MRVIGKSDIKCGDSLCVSASFLNHTDNSILGKVQRTQYSDSGQPSYQYTTRKMNMEFLWTYTLLEWTLKKEKDKHFGRLKREMRQNESQKTVKNT